MFYPNGVPMMQPTIKQTQVFIRMQFKLNAKNQMTWADFSQFYPDRKTPFYPQSF
jgi:hypothetical protein